MKSKKLYNIIRIILFLVFIASLVSYEIVLNNNLKHFQAIYDASAEIGILNSIRITQYTMVIYVVLLLSIFFFVCDGLQVLMVCRNVNKRFNIIMLLIQFVVSAALNILLFCMVGNLEFQITGYIICGIWVGLLITQTIWLKLKRG